MVMTQILSDPEKKKLYDQFGEAGINPQFQGPGAGAGAGGMPEGFFNMGGMPGGFRVHRGGGGGECTCVMHVMYRSWIQLWWHA